jgi:hypothetical protein
MNLDLRKVLALDQWRQLKSIRGQSGGFGDKIFFRKVPPPAGPSTMPLPPGAPQLLLSPSQSGRNVLSDCKLFPGRSTGSSSSGGFFRVKLPC